MKKRSLDERLMRAAQDGDLEGAKRALDEGANLNFTNEVGQTPLHLAIQKDMESIVGLLLDKNADIGIQDSIGMTPLHYSLSHGLKSRLSALRLIQIGKTFNRCDEDDWTALHYAAQYCPECVQPLLDAGANFDVEDRWQRTPLFVAIEAGQPSAISALVKAGADINSRDSNDFKTALMAAAEAGLDGVVEEMIAEGAEVNLKNHIGETALMMAVKSGNPDSAKTLIAAGADIEARDHWGKTALMVASIGGQADTIKALIAAGADVNARDGEKKPALQYAAQKDQKAIVRLLLDFGAEWLDTDRERYQKKESDDQALRLIESEISMIELEKLDQDDLGATVEQDQKATHTRMRL